MQRVRTSVGGGGDNILDSSSPRRGERRLAGVKREARTPGGPFCPRTPQACQDALLVTTGGGSLRSLTSDYSPSPLRGGPQQSDPEGGPHVKRDVAGIMLCL